MESNRADSGKRKRRALVTALAAVFVILAADTAGLAYWLSRRAKRPVIVPPEITPGPMTLDEMPAGLRILITGENECIIGGKTVPVNGIGDTVAVELHNRDTRVLLSAYSDVPYAEVMNALAQLRRCGITDVTGAVVERGIETALERHVVTYVRAPGTAGLYDENIAYYFDGEYAGKGPGGIAALQAKNLADGLPVEVFSPSRQPAVEPPGLKEACSQWQSQGISVYHTYIIQFAQPNNL
ncbi:MAG: hypothetical protein JW909_13020 [Planctomycetes bacterium]|nr:hypothetical protein [Planctomycetota bacterium]